MVNILSMHFLLIFSLMSLFGYNCFAKDKELIILNVDPGIDDAWAILFALGSPEVELMGVTVSFGNIENMTNLTQNALRILEMAGRYDIPVFAGARGPITGVYESLGSEDFHGHDGLGDIGYPLPKGHIQPIGAVEFIVKACRDNPGKVNILSVGPATNIAVALELEPKLPQLVKRIYLMGGTITYPGNVYPLGEANVVKDSHAAHQVFAAGFKITMVGLDVTMRVEMYPKYFDSIKALGTNCGKFIWELAQYYLNSMKKTGFPFSPCHDPSTIMALIHPEIYKSTTDYPVRVYATGYPDEMDGVVVVDRRAGPDSPTPPVYNTTLLLEVDQDKFKEIFKAHISTLP